MKGKANLIFVIVDLVVLVVVLMIEAGFKQGRLMNALFFALVVRGIILAIISLFGFLIRMFVVKDTFYSFWTTIILGYLLLILIYLNENGIDHWEKTLISLHSSWKYFGQIIFPFLVASITTYLIGKKWKIL